MKKKEIFIWLIFLLFMAYYLPHFLHLHSLTNFSLEFFINFNLFFICSHLHFPRHLHLLPLLPQMTQYFSFNSIKYYFFPIIFNSTNLPHLHHFLLLHSHHFQMTKHFQFFFYFGSEYLFYSYYFLDFLHHHLPLHLLLHHLLLHLLLHLNYHFRCHLHHLF